MYKIRHVKRKLGQSSHPLYKTYESMVERCYNKKGRDYSNYGGRGISICEEWRGTEGFIKFAEFMGTRPSPGMQIDRIDNDGNYEPNNVRWATRRQQALNTRLRVTNTSGAKGISWEKRRNLWHARLTVNYKNIHVGYFKDFQDAVRARAEREEQYS